MKKAIVTGAGGFIGCHLTRYLKDRGFWVKGVDVKRPEFGPIIADEYVYADLRYALAASEAIHGAPWVFALAADMGGMGFISQYHREIHHNNSLININTAAAARMAGVERVFFASSACVYPESLQAATNAAPLKESDAYPAAPQDAYGWEKLDAEKRYQEYAQEGMFDARIARFHNVYGPEGCWDGGREKAPAALCRKVAEGAMAILLRNRDWVEQTPYLAINATPHFSIEVWGDGQQTRSFMYIDDCVEGIYRLMSADDLTIGHGEHLLPWQPVNLGSDRMVSINELVDIIGQAAGYTVNKNHVGGPQGVRGRNSDNTLCRQVLDWEPQTALEDGIAQTYAWIIEQVKGKMVPAQDHIGHLRNR